MSQTSVGVIHMESLANCPVRQEQMSYIFPALAESSSHSLLVGDFNFSDGWDEERALDSDYIDVWKSLHPDEAGSTMPSNLRWPEWRPDHVMLRTSRKFYTAASIDIIGDEPLPGPTCPDCTAFERPCTPSDHFGLVCSLTFRESTTSTTPDAEMAGSGAGASGAGGVDSEATERATGGESSGGGDGHCTTL